MRSTQKAINSERRVVLTAKSSLLLEQLRDCFKVAGDRWELVYFDDADEALAFLDTHETDALVLDENSRCRSGHELLSQAQAKHPRVVRLVVTTEADPRVVYRCFPYAHAHVLTGPGLAHAATRVQRNLWLRDLMLSKEPASIIGPTIPAPPPAHRALSRVLRQRDPYHYQVTDVIEQYPEVAKITMGLATSKVLGRAESLTSMENAVLYFGASTIANIVLAVDLKQHFTPKDDRPDIAYRWLATAVLARRIVPTEEDRDMAFMAGVTHDFGKLVWQANSPETWRELMKQSRKRKVPLQRVERDLFGVTHADLAAYLLAYWGFPSKVIAAVQRHHTRPPKTDTTVSTNGALYLAAALTEQVSQGALKFRGETANAVDLEYTVATSVGPLLKKWQDLAEDMKYSTFRRQD